VVSRTESFFKYRIREKKDLMYVKVEIQGGQGNHAYIQEHKE
jgi:hypothetical protein